MIKVLVKKLNPKAELPKYKTEGSSGMDLMALIENPIIIKPQTSALIPTGLSVAIPQDTEIQIRPRSGLAAKHSITSINSPGLIDPGYTGEIKVPLINHSDETYYLKISERFAQLVLIEVGNASFNIVDNLNVRRRSL